MPNGGDTWGLTVQRQSGWGGVANDLFRWLRMMVFVGVAYQYLSQTIRDTTQTRPCQPLGCGRDRVATAAVAAAYTERIICYCVVFYNRQRTDKGVQQPSQVPWVQGRA